MYINAKWHKSNIMPKNASIQQRLDWHFRHHQNCACRQPPENLFTNNYHQIHQIEIINRIENDIKNNSLNFSTVEPVDDYEKDSRICLTGIHFPASEFSHQIQKELIDPLKKITPEHFYYPEDSLHITVKNIRVINDPPKFNDRDVVKVKEVFDKVVPGKHSYKAYFYRLLLFPANLALIGTTDPELDAIVVDLDKELKNAGVPDDKKYVNDKYFFSNITLARFARPVTDEFVNAVNGLSSSIKMKPYMIDSITLLTSNAVLKKRKIIGNWMLV